MEKTQNKTYIKTFLWMLAGILSLVFLAIGDYLFLLSRNNDARDRIAQKEEEIKASYKQTASELNALTSRIPKDANSSYLAFDFYKLHHWLFDVPEPQIGFQRIVCKDSSFVEVQGIIAAPTASKARSYLNAYIKRLTSPNSPFPQCIIHARVEENIHSDKKPFRLTIRNLK